MQGGDFLRPVLLIGRGECTLANIFRKKIPAEFTDEDRWRFGSISVSRTTFYILLIGLGCTYGLFQLLTYVHLQMVGMWFGVIMTLIVTVLCGFKLPAENYMHGAGITLMTLLFRIFIRKKNKVVYIRGYKKDLKE